MIKLLQRLRLKKEDKNMNKKLVYLFAILVAGLFVFSACEQGNVGGPAINRNLDGGVDPIIKDKYIDMATIATGETFMGVKLVSVSANGNQARPDSCNIVYQKRAHTINEKYAKIMSNGNIIGVSDITISNEQQIPDYCEIIII